MTKVKNIEVEVINGKVCIGIYDYGDGEIYAHERLSPDETMSLIQLLRESLNECVVMGNE